MADPHASAVAGALGGAGLIASLTGAVGPVAAEWSIVLAAAIIGAAIAARDLETKSAGAVWWLMARGVGLSLLFTAGAARLLSSQIDVAASDLLWPLAGLIAWQQDRLYAVAIRFIPTRKDPP